MSRTWSHHPPDDAPWSIFVELLVGPSGTEGEESFGVTICNGAWLDGQARAEGVAIGRHHMVMASFDWTASDGLAMSDLGPRLEAAGWRVSHDELGPRRLAPFGRPTAAEVPHLTEDLLQAIAPDGRVLDVGWYPSGDEAGCFVVLLVADGRWDEPLARHEARTVSELVAVVVDLVGEEDADASSS
jgi:hypothetical protein